MNQSWLIRSHFPIKFEIFAPTPSHAAHHSSPLARGTNLLKKLPHDLQIDLVVEIALVAARSAAHAQGGSAEHAAIAERVNRSLLHASTTPRYHKMR